MQRLAEVGAPGLVNFITAVAYHFCPSLPTAFSQPDALTLAVLCTNQRENDRLETERKSAELTDKRGRSLGQTRLNGHGRGGRMYKWVAEGVQG